MPSRAAEPMVQPALGKLAAGHGRATWTKQQVFSGSWFRNLGPNACVRWVLKQIQTLLKIYLSYEVFESTPTSTIHSAAYASFNSSLTS